MKLFAIDNIVKIDKAIANLFYLYPIHFYPKHIKSLRFSTHFWCAWDPVCFGNIIDHLTLIVLVYEL